MTTLAADIAAPPPVVKPTLTNQRLALSTMLAAQDAAANSTTRLCVLYGHSGYGKTVGAATVAARLQAVYYEAKAIVTTKSFLEDLAFEVGVADRARTAAGLFYQIRDALRTDPRPIIIDEADYLLKGNNDRLVNVVRDICDATAVPIMLIGMEALPAKLKRYEQFDNRIIASTAAQPASVEDTRLLQTYYCPYITLADDLADEIARATRGVTRRIVANLQMVQSVALDDGRDVADLPWWRTLQRPLMTGDLPTRRKIA